ncbi:UNVERIFIED_CONTAM: hypothetical protein HDU68_001929 [Siphonaria sp. JEL0065]|nr:hypothetical protein HDU68_001929 [Siphonaria sp. JEL0065]
MFQWLILGVTTLLFGASIKGVTNTRIGNYKPVVNISNDTILLAPASWTNITDCLTNLMVNNAISKKHMSLAKNPDKKSKDLVLQVNYTTGVGGKTGAVFDVHPGNPPYTNYTRMSLSYDVWFPKGFNFVKEGKLPGLWGKQDAYHGYFDCGNGYDVVHGSHGPCWSVRGLWRSPTSTKGKTGLGAAYVYAPRRNIWCTTKTTDMEHGTYCALPSDGDIVGRNFQYSTGTWNKILIVVDVRQKILQLSLNGKLMISYNGVNYGSSTIKFAGIKWETFFGGGSQSFKNPYPQVTYFRYFELRAGNGLK